MLFTLMPERTVVDEGNPKWTGIMVTPLRKRGKHLALAKVIPILPVDGLVFMIPQYLIV
jgi:hypothetical protein